MTNREDQLIERIRRRIPSSPGGILRVGIGDDAAVLRPARGTEWVITCDQFIEDVHFLGDVSPPESVGYKALARATSDLAAMGARPRLFLLSMALPANRSGKWLDAMLRGMAKAARQFGLRLAGGDSARIPGAVGNGNKVALDLTVLGEVAARRAVLRSGARPGDAVFVAGPANSSPKVGAWLGAAQLGLELLLRGAHRQPRWRRLMQPHYYPVIHVELGAWLAQRRLVSAMMDLSDGLSTDLDRLCRASGVGARLQQTSLPLVALPKELRGFDSLTLGLHGGEDYGLLFTVPKRLVSRIPSNRYGARLTRVGEIVRGRGIKLIGPNGRISTLEPRGWDHFRRGTNT